MSFKELAEARYSCRAFSDRKVEPEMLDTIIATALKAPTAKNMQPFRIFIMDSAEAKETVRKSSACTYGADTFLVVGYRKGASWDRPFDGHDFAEVDAAIVATHIMMQVSDLGLCSTWVANFNAPMLKEAYPSMQDYELVALFPIGYPAENAAPSERHFIRKTREELCETL